MASGELHAWFNAVDADNSGLVDVDELVRALGSGGLHFSKQAAALLIRMYDRERKGLINFQEFVGLHSFIVSVQQSFERVDEDKSGTLSQQEVWRALGENGFSLDQHAFEAVFAAFDCNRSRSLGLDDFIQMAAFLSSARQVFSAFDSAKQGRVQLDLNQFYYASAHLR